MIFIIGDLEKSSLMSARGKARLEQVQDGIGRSE